MKRLSLGLVLSLALAGLATAQGLGQGPQTGGNQNQPALQQAPVAKSIEGKLAFVDDYPALQTKDKTYILRMPRFYYYAYTEGFKAGDQMKLDGFELPALPGQDKPFFVVTKATVGTKVFDFSASCLRMMGGQGMMGGRGMMNFDDDDGFGPGSGRRGR